MKILYIMSIPWGWIKQRPHFLAEKMAQDSEVDVYYKRPIHASKSSLKTEIEQGAIKSITPFNVIPFNYPKLRWLPLGFINRILIRLQFVNFSKYDYVWIGNASLYSIFKPVIPKTCKVVYDCMDDILEFEDCMSDPVYREYVANSEKSLLQDAKHVFCSADFLSKRIQERSGISRDITIVNNAIEVPKVDVVDTTPIQSIIDKLNSCKYPLLYIGTIAEWFDFELIIKYLDANDDVKMFLVGPVVTQIPNHKQIIHLGTVDRKYIFSLMDKAWVLTMPFKVTELIKSVNPVKLYEYIYMGKPSIAPKYGESLKFGEHVFLYSDYADLKGYLDTMKITPELSNEKKEHMKEFVEHNTWDNRCNQVKTIMKI